MKMLRIFFLVTANVLGVLLLLGFLGVISFKGISTTVKQSIGLAENPEPLEYFRVQREKELELLEEQEQQSLLESFELQEQQLASREQDMQQREQTLVEERIMLRSERENILLEQEQSQQLTAELESYELKVQALAGNFINMRPELAAERLLALNDDILILDVLKAMDVNIAGLGQTSIVPYLLSLMPADDVGRLMKKSTVGL